MIRTKKPLTMSGGTAYFVSSHPLSLALLTSEEVGASIQLYGCFSETVQADASQVERLFFLGKIDSQGWRGSFLLQAISDALQVIIL